MATIYADSQDGYVARHNQTSWSNARATTTGAGHGASETGEKALMVPIYELLLKNQDKERMIMLRNEWIPVSYIAT